MTVTVHSHGKWVVLSRDGADNLRHEVPRKNKFFKEELRLFERKSCLRYGESSVTT